jgi:hypothetical protein
MRTSRRSRKKIILLITVNKCSKEWNKLYTVQNVSIFKIRNNSRVMYNRTNQSPPSQAESISNKVSIVDFNRGLEQMENKCTRKPWLILYI